MTFLTDRELIDRLSLPYDIGKTAIAELDKGGQFPQKWPLFGNRRWWPAVLQFFLARYGGLPRDVMATPAVTWEEDFDACKPAARKTTRAPVTRTVVAEAIQQVRRSMGGETGPG